MKISIKNVVLAILYVFIILFVALISFEVGTNRGKFEKTLEVSRKLSIACFEQLTKN